MNDIVIVGGGPAGCFTAGKLAEKGYEVTILEEHGEIGQPMSCAGIVGGRGLKRLGLNPKKWMVNELKGANLYGPDGTRIELSRDKVEAYVIDRSRFDRDLAEYALRAGAELLLNTKCRDIKFDDKKASLKIKTLDSGDNEIHSRLIIGADGVNSIVARKAGLIKEFNSINCAQIESIADIDDDTVELYFDMEFSPGFFTWIVPSLESHRIGLGSINGGSVQKLFKFIKNHPIASSKISEKTLNLTIGQIPGVKSRKIYGERVILVGDAAGHVKPITGGGLYLGLSCASIATDIIPKVMDDEPSNEKLSIYEDMVNKKFGQEFKFGLRAQRVFREMSNMEINEIMDLLSEGKIRDLILENADFDHHSKLFKALIENSPSLIKSIGVGKIMKYINRLIRL